MKECHKVVYKTKDAARKAGNSMVAKGMTVRFRIYRCPWCKPYFHVTHMSRDEHETRC